MRNCTQSRAQVNTQQRRERERLAQHAARGARILARLQGRVILHYEWLSLKASSQYRDRAASYRCIRLLCACVCSSPSSRCSLPSIHIFPLATGMISGAKREESSKSSRWDEMIEKDRYFEKWYFSRHDSFFFFLFLECDRFLKSWEDDCSMHFKKVGEYLLKRIKNFRSLKRSLPFLWQFLNFRQRWFLSSSFFFWNVIDAFW